MHIPFLQHALDAVFPPQCLGCKKYAQTYLCHQCFNSIPLNVDFVCLGCGVKTESQKPCPECISRWSLDGLYVATQYSHPLLEKVIKGYKYRFIDSLSVPLAKLMGRYLVSIKESPFKDNPLLVSVPLHPRRFRWRGFNQSDLLAKELSINFGLEYINCLVKNKATQPQAEQKDKESRMNNIGSSFRCINSEVVKGRSILLIDDICTTGATLNECARVLKESGAQIVFGFTVARG